MQKCALQGCGRKFPPYGNKKYCCAKHREAAQYARRFTPKGLKYAPKFTMRPGKCPHCGADLPTPRPNRQTNCDNCLGWFDREKAKETSKQYELIRGPLRRRGSDPAEPRTCQHRDTKDGPICGVVFVPKPRIGADGENRGVHADQVYCPKHQKPKAVARRRWLNRDVDKYRAGQRRFRAKHLTTVRAKQRRAAKAKRDRVTKILGQPAVRLLMARTTLAALLTIKGMSRRAMRGQLYPKTEGADRQYDSTNKLFREHREEINLEVQRLAAFTEARRKV